MAVPTTWTELKAEIADWIERDDLTSQIPGFIGYAEARFRKVLRVPEMESESSASVSTSTISLPADFLALKTVYIDSDPRSLLEEMSPGRLRERFPNDDVTGTPTAFALEAGSELILGPYPDTTYTIVITYYASIPALGAGQATNWLLTSHPDLYVAASLAEANLLMMDEQRASVWDSRTQAKIAELIKAGHRKARSETGARLRSDIPVRQSFNITLGY